MQKSGFAFLLLSLPSLAFAQLDSNSITVTASNNVALQPDQAIFSVVVQSGISTGLDDVLAALQGSGITLANFSGVSTNQIFGQRSSSLLWAFNLPAPLTNTKATVASLTTLQQNIANQNNGLTLSFNITGTQISPQLAQSQTCSLPALISSATTQAQNLATAGGLALGPILALSGSTSTYVASPYAAAPACAVTVKFNVTRH